MDPPTPGEGASSVAEPLAPPAEPRPMPGIFAPEDARAYRRFLEWSVGMGFKLAVLEVTAPRDRDALLAWTAEVAPGLRVVKLDAAERRPVWTVLEDGYGEAGDARVLALTRLEEAADRARICAQLNIQRDELVRAFPVPWVFVVHPSAALDLLRDAPDFCDFAALWLRERVSEARVAGPSADERGMLAQAETLTEAQVDLDGAPSSSLLTAALTALAAGRMDDAVDLLAQYDLHNPGARAENPVRIMVDGELRLRRGEPIAALDRFGAALSLGSGSGNERLRWVLLIKMAHVRGALREYGEVLRLCRQALDVTEHLRDGHLRAITLAIIANIRVITGHVDAALTLHQERLKLYEELGDKGRRALVLQDIALVLIRKGQVDAALASLQEAQAIFEELGNRRGRAAALGGIAGILARKGQIDAALALMQEARAVFQELGDKHQSAIMLGNIAQILSDRGQLDDALEMYQETRAVFEELGDKHSRARALGLMARVLNKKGQVDAALALHGEALKVFEELGDRRERAISLGDIANNLVRMGQIDAALTHYKEQLAELEELQEPEGIAYALASIGRIHAMQGGDAEALRYMTRAHETLTQLGYVDALAAVGADLGSLLWTGGRREEARTVLRRSIELFEKIGWKERAEAVCRLLATLESGA